MQTSIQGNAKNQIYNGHLSDPPCATANERLSASIILLTVDDILVSVVVWSVFTVTNTFRFDADEVTGSLSRSRSPKLPNSAGSVFFVG